MTAEIWRAWLAAAVLWAGAPAAAVILAMMIRLIPGTWRDSLAGPLALTPRILVIAALAMAPVLAAPGLFYGWVAHPGGGAFREVWLSPLFFAARGVAWLALLTFLALRLADGKAHRITATLGLLITVPISTVMADDWIMSLDPSFASSGFGLYVLAIQMNAALGLAIFVADHNPLSPRARDVLGGVLLVSLILWAYLGFMQYFITWSGDLPPGVGWYLRRGGGWVPLIWVAMALKLAPGFLLIFAHVRRNPKVMKPLAAVMALAAVPETAWLVLPAPGVETGLLAIAFYLGFVVVLGLVTIGALKARGLSARPAS